MKLSEKKRVLIYVDRWASGGIESFIVTFLENVSTKDFNFTIVTSTKESQLFDERLSRLDVNFVTLLDEFSAWYIRPFKMLIKFKEFIRDEHFDVYHFHIYNAISLLYPALIDRKRSVIVHSHNADVSHNYSRFVKLPVHKMFRTLLVKKRYTLLAVSQLAGKWMFKNSKFTIINNGIDSKKFKFSTEIRKKYREIFNFDDNTLVFLNVGRLNEQKNQTAFIEILKYIKNNIGYKVKGLIIGDGELRTELENKIKTSNMDQNISILSGRDDLANIASMSDVFVLPSLYEGLPLVGVEMQSNGLVCFFSSNVDEAIKITEKASFINIEEPYEIIAKKMISLLNEKLMSDRKLMNQIVEKNGFDIQSTVDKIVKLYK
ncbi:glycosyltransferase family 1 protein [Leuconostoc lactis]|nr:glycosyltransferase family 1 protein [Leuconostoc lactis]